MSTAAVELRRLYADRPRSYLLRFSLAGLGALTLYAWLFVIEPGQLWTPRRRANLLRFLREDALPRPLRQEGSSWSDLGPWLSNQWQTVAAQATLTTLWIAVAAVALAGICSLLLAPLGSRSLMTRDPYSFSPSTKRPALISAVPTLARGFCVLLRAVPEYIWAFLLMAMLPASALPAVLALAIHNAGILGRLGADTIENLERAPLRALRLAGARRIDLTCHGILPLGLPRWLLYFFYRFETCVREATVLGLLGIASLGASISEARARGRYDEMLLLVACGAGIVLFADFASFLARRWVRRGT